MVSFCLHEKQNNVFLAFLHHPEINSLSCFLFLYSTLQLHFKNSDPCLRSLFNVLLITIWPTSINPEGLILIVGKMNPFSKISTCDSLTWGGHHKGWLKFTVKKVFKKKKKKNLYTYQKCHVVHWGVHITCQCHNKHF